jgi:GNAT superfamily N-acetyltransferase
MSSFAIRPATTADIPVIVRHRSAMFSDMGLACDFRAMEREFTAWLERAMPEGIYHGALVVAGSAEVVAGGGLSVLPWPPGPRDLSPRIAYVYNVYTEPAFRRRGLARLVMESLHRWCRARGIWTVALHASEHGRRLYETMGYRATNEMRLSLEEESFQHVDLRGSNHLRPGLS